MPFRLSLEAAGVVADIRWSRHRMQFDLTKHSRALQTNLSPVQLTLPGIAFAPTRVREHGLVEAHTWPLVSDGKVQGVVQASFRVHASIAWSFPSLELRSATAWPVICLDCDGTDGHARLILAVHDREIPCPNWVVYRDAGGAHGVWCLARPVLRGTSARARPLRLLTRATEYMAQKVEADAGYGQVLSHNPMVPVAAQRLRTDWLRRQPYPLQELAEVVPFGWRRPAVPSTGIGRNCSLFEAGMKWAGSPANLGIPALTALMAINAEVSRRHGKPPLDASEVSGIAKSVERYRARWIARGQFGKIGDRERSAWGRERGLKGGVASGKARRKRNEARDQQIVAAVLGGEPMRAVARLHSLRLYAVQHIVNRDTPLFRGDQ